MKVLIIANNAISQYGNNGKTLLSFIKNIPPQNVAQLYFGTNEYPDLNVCYNYYRITEPEIFKSLVSLKFKTLNSHDKLISQQIRLDFERKESIIVRGAKRHKATLAIFRDKMWDIGTWDTAELAEWIEGFKPTVIFAVLGSCIFVHKIALKLSNRYKLPLSVYFTDDYVMGDISRNYLQKLHYRCLKKIYNKTLCHAYRAFVIGEKMRDAYRQYFRRDFGILVNSINIEKFAKFKPNRIDLSKPILISYIGGLHLNRWKTIVRLAKSLSTQMQYSIQYRIFSIFRPDEYILKEFSKIGISYCGHLDYEGVIKQMENTHFLLHVESFDPKNKIYTKYSVSTKIPEYMASRRGIIAYGPSEIASIEIFKSNNIGCVITEKDTDRSICDKVLNFIENYNQYDFDKQYKFAAEHFDQKNMQLDKILI